MSFRSRRSLHRLVLLLTGIAAACTLQVPKENEVFSEAAGRGGKSSAGGSGNGGAGETDGGTTSGGSSTSGGFAGASGSSGFGGTSAAGTGSVQSGGTGTTAGSSGAGAAPQAGVPANGGNATGIGGASGGLTSTGGNVNVGGNATGNGGANQAGNAGADASGGVGLAGAGAGGITSTGGSGTGGAPDPLSIGLVAHFKFDETTGQVAINSIDASKPGTLMGLATHATGRFGRAVRIRNDKVTTDYVDLPAGLLTGLSETTISIWVQDLSIDRKGSRAYDFGTGTGNNIFLSPHALNPATAAIGAQVAGAIGGLAFVNVWSDVDYALNSVWHLFTVTWNAEAIRFYVDGVLVATKDAPTALPSEISPSPNWLGKTFNDAAGTMYAHLDDLRIYDRVLAEAQILGLYQAL